MSKKPYFLWDYNLTENDVRRLLREGSEQDRQWLIARILEHAHFQDVFDYLTIQDVIKYFPKIKLGAVMRQYWQRALTAWGYHV